MRRRIYHKKKTDYSLILWLLLIASVISGAVYLYRQQGFNPQKLVDNSVLQGRRFGGEVKEVAALDGKLKAYLLEDKTNPIISIDFIFKGAGAAADPSGKEGLAKFTAAMLKDGAGDYTAQQFKEELEDYAIGLSFSAGSDDFGGRLVTTKENAAKAYELLKLVLQKPRFDDKDMQRTKSEFRLARQKQTEHPASELSLVFNEELYGIHPYGRNPLGNAAAVDGFKADDLRQMMANRLAQSNLIIGVAGDINAEELKQVLLQVFGELPEKARVNFVRDAEVNFDNRSRNIDRKTGQTISLSASRGTSRSSADFYPLYVANYIYGGAGLNSRLAQAVREKEGLVYSISSGLGMQDKSNLVVGSFSTTPENFAAVSKLVAAERQKFATEGASQAELQQAKDYLIAWYNLRFAAIDDISQMLVMMQKDNLGADFLRKRNDYIESVSLEEVNKAAAAYFADETVTVNIGNFK